MEFHDWARQQGFDVTTDDLYGMYLSPETDLACKEWILSRQVGLTLGDERFVKRMHDLLQRSGLAWPSHPDETVAGHRACTERGLPD